jgi:hypothetical protein
MRSRAARLAVLVFTGSALVAACTSTASAPMEPPSAATATTAVSSQAAAVPAAGTPTLAATVTRANAPGAVAFFQAQQGACAQHAVATGNPVVEPDRFSGATQVSNLGNGAYLVRDGRGTELRVEPGKGVVLPPSGNSTDLMPSPYGFGCPETVFVGAADA